MLRAALTATLLGALLALPVFAAGAEPSKPPPSVPGMVFELRDFPQRADPPLPDPATFPIQLVLDDDGAEGVFGIAGGTARQFLWFNRFAHPGPFTLEEIWVLFPSGLDVPVDGDVQLAVYLDPDGDPATGAQLLATYDDATIQVADGDTFSVYPLAPPLTILDPGDVLIGVVNRYFMPGDPPPTLPAALDTTASLDSSYFALWSGDADDPPELDTAVVIDVLDGMVSGNFMIRGFGRLIGAPIIPTVSQWGLMLLAGLIGAFAVWRLRGT